MRPMMRRCALMHASSDALPESRGPGKPIPRETLGVCPGGAPQSKDCESFHLRPERIPKVLQRLQALEPRAHVPGAGVAARHVLTASRSLANMPSMSALQCRCVLAAAQRHARLARGLGLDEFASILDDALLKATDSSLYHALAREVHDSPAISEAFLEEVRQKLEGEMKALGIEDAVVTARIKSLASVREKARRKGASEIDDVIGVRIRTTTVEQCYAALQRCHELWPHVPGRDKDYIATPKANNYQSLHTTVQGPCGQKFEIQIRTEEMHRTATTGTAAHSRYKEASALPSNAPAVRRDVEGEEQ